MTTDVTGFIACDYAADRVRAGRHSFGVLFSCGRRGGLGRARSWVARPSPGRAATALRAADRPADILPLIGWTGNTNWGTGTLPVASVLRSWEDRFGARLLRVGFAKISLLATRPPRDLASAQLLAAEHFAFCNECAGLGLHDIASISRYLMTSPVWTFWWD